MQIVLILALLNSRPRPFLVTRHCAAPAVNQHRSSKTYRNARRRLQEREHATSGKTMQQATAEASAATANVTQSVKETAAAVT